MLNVWLWLYYSSLWAWDWMQTAVHDPDFWSYRIADFRLFSARADFWPGRIDITIDWFGRFEIYHPIDEAGWHADPLDYPVKYVYPVDYDKIPF